MTEQLASPEVLTAASFADEILLETLSSIFATDPELSGSEVGPRMTGCVTISGTWNGSVLLSCSERLARAVAVGMFDMPDDELSVDEISDALGELTNVVGGGIKSQLPEPTTLSVPTVAEGLDFRMHVPNAHLAVQRRVAYAGEDFEIEVWQA